MSDQYDKMADEIKYLHIQLSAAKDQVGRMNRAGTAVISAAWKIGVEQTMYGQPNLLREWNEARSSHISAEARGCNVAPIKHMKDCRCPDCCDGAPPMPLE